MVNEAVHHGRGKSVWVQLQVDRNVILEFGKSQPEVAAETTNKLSDSQKSKVEQVRRSRMADGFAYMQRSANASAGAPS